MSFPAFATDPDTPQSLFKIYIKKREYIYLFIYLQLYIFLRVYRCIYIYIHGYTQIYIYGYIGICMYVYVVVKLNAPNLPHAHLKCPTISQDVEMAASSLCTCTAFAEGAWEKFQVKDGHLQPSYL